MVYLNIEELLKKNQKSKYWLVKQLDSNYIVINNMIAHNQPASTLRPLTNCSTLSTASLTISLFK